MASKEFFKVPLTLDSNPNLMVHCDRWKVYQLRFISICDLAVMV